MNCRTRLPPSVHGHVRRTSGGALVRPAGADLVATGLVAWVLVSPDHFVDVFMDAARNRADRLVQTFLDSMPLPTDR